MSKPLISLCTCVYNTSHLLKRSIETWANQDLYKTDWELIVIDDMSEDNVLEVIEPYQDRINIIYERQQHSYGMRGNTAAFNRAFKLANANIIAETTPETMFPPNMLSSLLKPHSTKDHIFVAAKTYNLTPELQLAIDTVDWREDLSQIMTLPGFFNDWTLNNFKTTHFGTHQTCSIKQSTFYEIYPDGFFLYGDYGSEDCNYSGRREQFKVKDITIMQPMAIHQWHPHYQYWMAKGKAPNANKWGHSMSNYLGDKSGHVPNGGTCTIWDNGSHEQLSDAEKADLAKLDDLVRRTGCTLV